MTEEERAQKKAGVVRAIIESKGFKTIACTKAGLNPRTFHNWVNEDPEFRQAVEDAVTIAREYRDDVAEQKLFSQVEAGDTTAIIFYCKTRLKNRGYSERAQPQEQPKPTEQKPALPGPDINLNAKVAMTLQKKITAKKTYIVSLLKRQGKYSPEMSMQVKIAAQLMVRTEILAEQIFDERHNPVNIEISREGNERESVSAKEKLYLDFAQQAQRALRALGMNTDSRERKNDGDGFNEFMEQFKKDEE